MRLHFEQTLGLLSSNTQLRRQAEWKQKCQPDPALACLRDYYAARFLLPVHAVSSYAAWFFSGRTKTHLGVPALPASVELAMRLLGMVVGTLPHLAIASTVLKVRSTTKRAQDHR